MRKQDKISLSESHRQNLEKIVRQGEHKAQVIRNAQIILKSALRWTDEQIAAAYNVHKRTVVRIRNHFLKYQAEDLVVALSHLPRSGAPVRFDSKDQALVIATACTPPPPGQLQWSLSLLSQQVSLELGKPISRETVRGVLKKTNYNPIAKSNGASPE